MVHRTRLLNTSDTTLRRTCTQKLRIALEELEGGTEKGIRESKSAPEDSLLAKEVAASIHVTLGDYDQALDLLDTLERDSLEQLEHSIRASSQLTSTRILETRLLQSKPLWRPIANFSLPKHLQALLSMTSTIRKRQSKFFSTPWNLRLELLHRKAHVLHFSVLPQTFLSKRALYVKCLCICCQNG